MTEYEIVRNGTQIRLMLKEKLTASDVPELQAVLKKEIGPIGCEIVFNMEKTFSLDSTGIGLLIATSNSLTSVQGTLRLVNVSSDIMKLLQSMRLVTRLHASAAEVLNG